MDIDDPTRKPAAPALGGVKSIAGSQIVAAGLAIVGAYAPFLVDYLLYNFWKLRTDPHQPLSNGFLWLVLVISGLVVHIALGTKAAIMCLMVSLESADVPKDRWSCGVAVVTTELYFQSLVALLAVYCLIAPSRAVLLTASLVGMISVGGAGAGLLAFMLLRSARKRANERRLKLKMQVEIIR